MSTTPNLGLTHLEPNQNSKTTTINAALVRIDAALGDELTLDLSGGDVTLGDAAYQTHLSFACTGHAGAEKLILPLLRRLGLIKNAEAAVLPVQAGPAGTTPLEVAADSRALVYTDGTTHGIVLVASSAGGATAFTGLSDVPGSYAGQGGKAVLVNGGATGLEFVARPIAVALFVQGKPADGEVVLKLVVSRPFTLPAGLTGSHGHAGSAATGTAIFDLRKNGSTVGAAEWAASATTATFTMASATSFAAGDRLELVAPATADATLADISLTLEGTLD